MTIPLSGSSHPMPLAAGEEAGWLTVGQQLKQARLALQVPFKDITAKTKIQSWVLEALEADRLHTTMNAVYAKGFLTTYAKHLHLNPEPLIVQLYPPAAASMPTSKSLPADAPSEPQRSVLFRRIVPLLLTVAAFLRRAGPALALTGVLIFFAKAKPISWPAIHLPRHEANVSVLPHPAPRRLPAEAPVDLPTTQPLELVLVAHRPTWVLVKADGKLVAQQQLATGTQETWTARKRFTLIVGAPAKTDVLLNGQSINPLVMAYHGRLAITHQAVKPLDDQSTSHNASR